jgi:hypothetical protein
MQIIKASRGNLREDFLRSLKGEGRAASIPLYVKKPNGKTGMLWRQCTREYKIDVVRRAIREYLGYKKRQRIKERVELWMGISTDEILRAKPSPVKYITNVFPLLDRGMSRIDCLRWMQSHGYPLPPKSACIGCPYHNDKYWRELKANYPDDFADACEFDRLLRAKPREQGELYLHRSCVPLSDIDLRDKASKECSICSTMNARECVDFNAHKEANRLNPIAHDEERWLSISREHKLHEKLNGMKKRRNRLRDRPQTDTVKHAMDAIEEVILEVADEYWYTINYNREKGWRADDPFYRGL